MPPPDRSPPILRLAAAAGALLLAFAILYGVLAWRAVKDEQVNRMKTVLEIAQKATNSYFVELEAALSGLAIDVMAGGALDDRDRNLALLWRFKSLHPKITAANLLNPQGKVLASASSAARATLPPLSQVRAKSFADFVAGVTPTTRMDLGRPLPAAIAKGWFFPIRYVLRGPDGAPVGFLSVTMPVDLLQDFWSSAPVVANASLGLVRGDGYLISLFPGPASATPEMMYGVPREGVVPRGAIDSDRAGYVEGESSILGQPAGYAFRRLENYPVTMFVATPLAEYWRAWWIAVRVPYALMLLLAAAGLLSFRVLRGREAALEAERRRAEAALADKRVAEQANRTKTEFMARMSHELRTPLNAILGFTQILQRDLPGTLVPDQQRDLRHVLHAGHHLLSLIDDLLDLSRVEAGTLRLEPADVDAADVLRDAIHQMAAQADAREVHLDLQVPADPLPPVRADRTRLRQVVLNLLSNAIKYNRRGGGVALRLQIAGGRLALTVRDTGPGLAPKQIGQLFQPFNRLGREGGDIPGTGIGLVITRSLVELMDGRLSVESEPGVGTEFRIDLPLSPRAAAAPADGTGDARPAGLPGEGEVVYIDDDEINRLLMQAYLAQRPGIGLRVAASGPEGLALVRAERPRLLLIDLMMPGMSGLEVLAAVRADPSLRTLPCLAISANAMPEEIDAAMRAGFDGYLVKPLAADVLLAEIDRRLAPIAPRAPQGSAA